MIKQQLGHNSKPWIGLKKPEDNCGNDKIDCRRQGWNWADGTSYSMTMWAPTEPKKGEVYGLLRKSGLVAKGNKSNKYRFICEKGNYSSDEYSTICGYLS